MGLSLIPKSSYIAVIYFVAAKSLKARMLYDCIIDRVADTDGYIVWLVEIESVICTVCTN